MPVVRPGLGGMHPAALLCVLGATCYAIYSIATRLLSRTARDPSGASAIPSAITQRCSSGTPRRRVEALSDSRVTFEAMSRAQVVAYVATGEPLGKAGAYAIQGKAAMHVTRIAGSYSGIMGLPMHETAQLLRAIGFSLT